MSAQDMTIERLPHGWRLAVDEVYATGRADLWSACTDPDRLSRWMAPYRGELALGGTWEALADDGVWGSGRVVACDPPRSFTTEWTADGEAPTLLRVELEEVPGGTRLRLVHEGVTDRYYAAGWAAYLAMLGDHLRDGGREDLGAAGFDERFGALRPGYDPVADAAGMP